MSTPVTAERRSVLHRRVRLIVGFTIAYNVIEAAIAIWAGVLASSAALIGFGLDSIVEVLSAVAVAWQFTRADPERWEKATVRAIGIAFFALAAYVIIDSALSLTGAPDVDHSPLGIGIATLSLLIMPLLAWIEIRTGRELGSRASSPTPSNCSCASTSPAQSSLAYCSTASSAGRGPTQSPPWSWPASPSEKASRPGAATSSRRSKCSKRWLRTLGKHFGRWKTAASPK